MLKLKHISVSSAGQKILTDISLEIKNNSFITIVGPSGSGKSTFLRLLNGLISYNQGEIFYKDKSYKDWDLLLLRREISLIFQKAYLFGETVKDNLFFPFNTIRKDIDIEKINKLLNEFNLPGQILNKRVNELSGGEQQRICLIRNLLLEPEILLLDEVTASLDPANTVLVENYLNRLYQKGKTIVMVTHNLEQAKKLGTYTIYLKDGQLIYYLPTIEFFALDDSNLKKFINGEIRRN